MSFEEQERMLFDLLFDSQQRQRFCKEPTTVFDDYDLDDTEQRDFTTIRPEALEFDAALRTDLILSQLCNSYPMTFSIIASLDGGIELLKRLIDTQTMRTPSIERTTAFGTRLHEHLVSFVFDRPAEQPLIIAILEAELGMAWTSAMLKREILTQGTFTKGNADLPSDWSSRSIKLAPYVSAAIIPQSYVQLKTQLCNGSTNKLWHRISHNPLSRTRRSKILEKEDPRLLISRARVSHASRCEPTIEHQTAELTEGFAPLFQHVNGSMSVQDILAQLKQAGASEQILYGVKTGFLQLLRTGMLETN